MSPSVSRSCHRLWITATLLVCVCLPAWAAGLSTSAVDALPPRMSPDRLPFVERPGELEFSGRMIVKPVRIERLLAEGLSPAVAARRAQFARDQLAGLVVEYFPEVDEYVIRVPEGYDENRLAGELLSTADYEYVEPDWICYPALTPNDPLFPNQWHHINIQSQQAWDITTGSDQITVAFTDTGIDLNHPDLAPHIVPGFNSATNLAQADGGDVSDINGHGTHVAGTAAAIGNNNQGVAGVGWNQRIMMVRVTNSPDGSASLSNILQGARWAAEHGARVVSSSYSGVEGSGVETTGRYIKENFDALYCYAAGNSSTDLSSFDHRDVVVVGASNQSDGRASFSSFGRAVDVFAPGVGIWSTRRGGGYGSASGTSFATPMTNGVISMIWSIDPTLSARQAEEILFRTADDIGDPGDDLIFGHGRVNVFNAATLAVTVSTTNLPPEPKPDNDYALGGQAKALDVTANDFDLNEDPLTIVSVESPTAAGATVTISPGSGPDGRDELIYTGPTGFSGTDTFSYTVSDGEFTADTTVSVDVTDPDALRQPENPPSTEFGLRVAYYDLNDPTSLPSFGDLSAASRSRLGAIAFPATDGNFATSGRADNVGAVFTGYIVVTQDALYTFYLESDDGSRLYIGNNLVIDNDGLHGMQEASSSIALAAGAHAFRVEYFERTGNAGVLLSISGAGRPKQLISPSGYVINTCREDVNGDGLVDLADLSTLLTNFGTTGNVTEQQGDTNNDLRIDTEDLSRLLEAFGTACP